MLIEELGKAWRKHEAETAIEPELTFRDEGLVLGAGTVLASAIHDGALVTLSVDDARLRTLLSVAYDCEVGGKAMGHIRRGARRWAEGEATLAAIHLAMTGLGKLRQPREASRRLFLADWMLCAGAPGDGVLAALGSPARESRLSRRYNEQESRVPKGSGRPSGRWTAGEALVDAAHQVEAKLKDVFGDKAVEGAEQALKDSARQAVRAAEQAVETGVQQAEETALATVTEEGELQLARFAALIPAAAVFGAVLFVPEPNDITHKWIDVPGRPGLRYRQRADTPGWQISYEGPHGVVEENLYERHHGVLSDDNGRVVGRVLARGALAIDLAVAAPSTVKPDEPRFCPVASPDRYGQGPGSVGRVYEDQIKALVNPTRPTPSGFGMALLNVVGNGNLVMFDDCEQSSGTMIEIKGPTYTEILEKELRSQAAGKDADWSVVSDLLGQSERQVQAAGARPIRWYFADQAAADAVRQIFAKEDKGRERIEVRVVPAVWRGR